MLYSGMNYKDETPWTTCLYRLEDYFWTETVRTYITVRIIVPRNNVHCIHRVLLTLLILSVRYIGLSWVPHVKSLIGVLKNFNIWHLWGLLCLCNDVSSYLLPLHLMKETQINPGTYFSCIELIITQKDDFRRFRSTCTQRTNTFDCCTFNINLQ